MSAYLTWRIVHRKSVLWIDAEKFLLFSLVQHGQDLHQISHRSRPLTAAAGGIILPVEIPHRVASILERPHPPHNACGHDPDHGQSGMSQQPYPAHQVKDVPVIFLLRAPRRQLRRFFKGELLNSGRPIRTGSGRGTSSI